jgi:hypothetical protein
MKTKTLLTILAFILAVACVFCASSCSSTNRIRGVYDHPDTTRPLFGKTGYIEIPELTKAPCTYCKPDSTKPIFGRNK